MNKKKIVLSLLAGAGVLSLIGCNTKPIEDIEKEQEGQKDKFNVTFMVDGAEVSKVEVSKGSKVQALATDPTKDGYNFVGWATSPDAVLMYNFDLAVTGAFTLYAVFEQANIPDTPITPSYTISFVVDGSVYETTSVDKGNKLDAPVAPTKDGYNFLGWTLTEGGTTLYDFNTTVEGVITLYAAFEEIEVVNLPEQYLDIISNEDLVVLNDDFNSYKTTDKLANFDKWGTKGFYQANSATDGTTEIKLGEGQAELYDTLDLKGDGSAKLIADFGDVITEGIVEGYFETTFFDQGGSWTFVQFFGTSAEKTTTSEVFGIRIDTVFKYRLNGGDPITTGIVNSVNSDNKTYKVYYKFNLDAKTLSITIDGKEYVTNLANTITGIQGIRYVSSDAGVKRQAIDNFAVRVINMTLDETKAFLKDELTKKCTSFAEEFDDAQVSLMTEVLNNQKTLIDNATNQTVYQVYDQAVVALKAKAAEINKTIYKNKLDSLVDSSLYTINQTALADAITAGKNAVEEATTTEAIIAAFNEAKTAINAIDNDEAALNKYKRDKSSELAKYKNESEYTTNLSALRQALTNGTNAISAATSINEVDQAFATAKSVIDQIKSDKELLDELKADAINDVNDVAELKTTALNASSFDDKESGIAKIQSIKTKAATDINQCKNAVDINEIKTKAISDIENEYKLCALSLADLKASLALDLNDLATEKLALESVKDDADAKTEITTSKNDGLALINSATTKEAATLAYNEARDAILETVKKTLISGVNVIEAKGDQESVYVTWGKNENVDTYNVYYKESSSSNWTKIDSDYLIRTYAEYNRVDIVGLKAGSYDVKVQAVVEGDEINSYAIVNELTVISYDRTGFAFDKTSANPTGDASGAYNADGTLKSNARVIYVTSKSAKTVKLKVKQDNKGTETEFTGLQAIIDAHQKGAEDRPLAIRFVGQVSASDMDKFSSSGEGLQIKGRAANSSMKMTFEGIGEDASIYGFGFLIRNCNNVEVRNLGFMTDIDDDVSIDTDNSNIWIHDNDFFYGHNGSGDHAKGDGALDIKGTMHATLSYNHFWDTGKTTLNSNGDEVNFVSYHHNWYDHSDSRHPRVRKSSAIHVYNNYFDGVSKYGVGATTGSSIFVENNYFRNTKFPVLISMQGSDIYAGTNVASKDNATFSSEAGGMIKTYGNFIEGATTTYVPYGKTSYIVKGQTTSLSAMNTLVDFDCYEASSRDEKVSASIVTKSGGTPYSNFDTDTSIMYTYTVQTPEDAVETIKAYSGRVNGGDLKWVFDNATEDTNYAVIPGLRKAIDTYKTKLLSIKAEGASTTPVNPTPNPPQPGENAYDSVIALINALPQTITLNDEAQITAAKTAYDALSADDKAQVTNKSKLDQAIEALNVLKTPAPAEGSVTVSFANAKASDSTVTVVTGSMLANKNFVAKPGYSFTTALKMESATVLEILVGKNAKITLVTDTPSKNVKIDGVKKATDANGLCSFDATAGTKYTITKGDTMNLYGIIIEYK